MVINYNMENLQKAIYETWQLWKEDTTNRDFYDEYVVAVVEDYPIHKENYLNYWESLKEHGNMVSDKDSKTERV